MAVSSLKEILDSAFKGSYGVPAINILNDLTLESVLAAAVESRSPLIVQTSVKTVRSLGKDTLFAMWKAMTRGIEVPVALHLDHCPERAVITDCLKAGWNSVLFDGSALPVEENKRQTVEVVEEARRYGADVEGEIEGIARVEDGVGSDTADGRQSLEVVVDFVRTTGVDVFAPAIGNAHGLYKAEPTLDAAKSVGYCGGVSNPHCTPRWDRDDHRPVQGPHRARLREDQYFHRPQEDLHALQLGLPRGRPRTRRVGSSLSVQVGRASRA